MHLQKNQAITKAVAVRLTQPTHNRLANGHHEVSASDSSRLRLFSVSTNCGYSLLGLGPTEEQAQATQASHETALINSFLTLCMVTVSLKWKYKVKKKSLFTEEMIYKHKHSSIAYATQVHRLSNVLTAVAGPSFSHFYDINNQMDPKTESKM